jgi:hypothetical protein
LQFVTHVPLPLQVAPDAFGSAVVQAWLHAPQLLGSASSLTQLPLQSE